MVKEIVVAVGVPRSSDVHVLIVDQAREMDVKIQEMEAEKERGEMEKMKTVAESKTKRPGVWMKKWVSMKKEYKKIRKGTGGKGAHRKVRKGKQLKWPDKERERKMKMDK